MTEYVALVYPNGPRSYELSFHDFPDTQTIHVSLDQARARAVDTLMMAIKETEEKGEPLPVPSSLSKVMAETPHGNVVSFFVAVPIKKPYSGLAVRINVSLPEDLLHEIDDYAKRHGQTRSGFFARAAQKVMGINAAYSTQGRRQTSSSGDAEAPF